MLALARFFILGFVVLTVVYLSVSAWSRAVRRDKLEAQWDETRRGDRDTFVKARLRDYDNSLRRKLILGVYVVPILLLGTIVYLTNFH